MTAPASLCSAVLARLDALIAGCRDASWSAAGHEWADTWASGSVRVSAYLAGHPPDRMLALYEGLRGEVERHDSDYSTPCTACGFTPPATYKQTCSVTRLAAMLGVEATP